MPVQNPIHVAALYKFATFPEPAVLIAPLARACADARVKGTLLVAREGINGALAGDAAGVAAGLDAIRALPGCADLDVKTSTAALMPFHRMKARLKAEIVTLGVEGLDPAREAGTYVEPADWNALIADPDTIVIDTRNAYEARIGTFPGAINPETARFRDFPAWFRRHRDALAGSARPRRVAMFCTGGIRCEKATAFLKAEGVADVRHLKGGILRYLETVPGDESLWRGECFVFDQRVAVGPGLAPGTHDLCHACRRPVSLADKASPLYRRGVSCPACADEGRATARGGYAERMRQVDLAAARGARHLGAAVSAKAPPFGERDDGPDALDEAEGPGALKKAISRAQRAGAGEGEREPAAPVLERVAHQHGGDGEEAEEGQAIHARRTPSRHARDA
jgi:UPF0176 protein